MRKALSVAMDFLLFAAVVLFFAWAGGQFLVLGDDSWIPQPVEMVNATSCKITQTGKTTWQAEAIAEYANPTLYHGGRPWTRVIGVFTEKSSLKAKHKAYAVCDQWQDSIEKAQREKLKQKPIPEVNPNQREKS